jgi:hypothetical protein
MRYNSSSEAQWLRRKSLGPVLAADRRHYALPVPGKGLQGLQHRAGNRVRLSGFGALTAFGPPTGAGAGAGAAIGASQGASIGSAIVPGIGTAIGAVVGAVGGAIAGAINKTDPENANFNQAVAMYNANTSSVYNIRNAYLFFAGLFDLNIKTNIPIYRKFGHMGEAAFTIWLCQTIYAAAQRGQITANDTALTVMSRIVQPAIDAWGYGSMSDPNQNVIQAMIVKMILDYTDGWGPANWLSVSGAPVPQFSQIPPFALPATSTPAPSAATPSASSVTASATPSPVAIPTQSSGVSSQATASQVTTLYPNSTGVLVTPVGTVTYNSDGSFRIGNTIVGFALAGGGLGIASITVNGSGQVVATFQNGGSSYWSTASGWWVPLTAAGTATAPAISAPQPAPQTVTAQSVTATPSTPSAPAPVVSNTPPAIGGMLSAGLDAVTNQMIGLPAGATYGGLTSSGAWIIVYASGANAGAYTIQSGQLTPYSATMSAAVAQTQQATTTAQSVPIVSTTPPQIGSAMTTLRDNATGQMVAIPAGGVYAGLTSTNGWLVAYPAGGANPAGTYESNNGVLTLYSGTAPSAVGASSTVIPVGYTASGQSILLNGSPYPLYIDVAGNQYVWTGSAMVPYQTALNTGVTTTSGGGGGGGGGFFPGDITPPSAPETDLSQPLAPVSSGLDSNTLLLLGAAAIGAYLLMERA